MCKRSSWLGVLALLVLASVLATASRSEAQVYNTAVINSPRGFTFFTYPAQYAPTFVGIGPYGWAGLGLAPAYGCVPPIVPQASPAPARPARPAVRTADFELRVPADAVVWLEGRRMKQTGAVRHFVSPPLATDKTYHYDLRIAWQEDGREMMTTRRLAVRAGQRQSLLVLGTTGSAERLVSGK